MSRPSPDLTAHLVKPTGPLATCAELRLPRAGLSTCVRGYISRSANGVPLTWAQRINRFPASPLCAITWFVRGQCGMLPWDTGAPAEAAIEPLPPIVFNGPFDGPSMSVGSPDGHAFMLVLLPDAFQALTGLEAVTWRNRSVAAETLLPAGWQPLLQAVMQAPDDPARVALIEDFLSPRWTAARSDGPAVLRSTHDWAHALMLRAATSGLGRSVRQMERRIKAWSGQPLRDLRLLARSEQSYFHAMQAQRDGAIDWAHIAQEAGYADQSHFCRETRRVTGYSPEALRLRMQTDESFWLYRIWG